MIKRLIFAFILVHFVSTLNTISLERASQEKLFLHKQLKCFANAFDVSKPNISQTQELGSNLQSDNNIQEFLKYSDYRARLSNAQVDMHIDNLV